MPPPCVAVFAHNEERHIDRCLDSLTRSSRIAEHVAIRVLVNGCIDRTESLVRAWAARHRQIEPIVIALGDKANAWNTYVYGGISFECNHYFLDGDCTLAPGALDTLEAEFQRAGPLCVAPLPQNVSARLRTFLTQWSLPCGTMYGLSGTFLQRVVAAGIRIPVGFIGDDNLIASLVHSDLDDRFGNYDRGRVRIVADTGPIVQRPATWSLAMLRLQHRRWRRYALRRVQMELLNIHVRGKGLRSLPTSARELSGNWRKPGLGWYCRWRGWETPFILRALWQVRREAQALGNGQIA